MNTLEKLRHQNRSAALLKEQKRFITGNFAPDFVSMEMSSLTVRFYQDERAFHWELEVPGLTKENVNVRVDGHWMVISENQTGKSQGQLSRKLFHQTLRIPSIADSAKATASWHDEVLKISMLRMKPKGIRRTIPVTGVEPAGILSTPAFLRNKMKRFASSLKNSFEKFRIKYALRNAGSGLPL